MADDLQSYKLQLQQVLSDPENSDLLILKKDLEEVLELTRKVPETQLEKQKKSSYVKPTSSTTYCDEAAKRNWKIGDKCQAKWTECGVYYDATIKGITGGGEAIVVFDAFQNQRTTTLKELKHCVIRNEVLPSAKRHRPNNKEYLKKKNQKQHQCLKELDEIRDQKKNKWLNFQNKITKKSGTTKIKSIFASPENANGRVGIGTCGVSGKPMTKF